MTLLIYLLVSSDCYAVGTVGYYVAIFHGCEDATFELQNQIQDPGTDLTCEGYAPKTLTPFPSGQPALPSPD